MSSQFRQLHKDRLLGIEDTLSEDWVLEVFAYQAKENPVYKQYLSLRGVSVNQVKQLSDIPFLPISCFKTHQVISGALKPELLFESSGTTGQQTSKHFIADPAFYEAVSVKAFTKVYGSPANYTFLGLLPSYLERGNSSLVYMVDHFIKHARQGSGFYLRQTDLLAEHLSGSTKAPLLIGVTFALLDMAERYAIDAQNLIVMETGGMKGRRREMVRQEVHEMLKTAFQQENIHSEYGMTELLSQCYATAEGFFAPPPWCQILIRDINDPFHYLADGQTGGINIIDLANIDSCCFIETMDLGRQKAGAFEVLGRFDYSDARGCNLMVS